MNISTITKIGVIFKAFSFIWYIYYKIRMPNVQSAKSQQKIHDEIQAYNAHRVNNASKVDNILNIWRECDDIFKK